MITAAEFRHGCCGQGTPVEILLWGKPELSSLRRSSSRITSCTYDSDFNAVSCRSTSSSSAVVEGKAHSGRGVYRGVSSNLFAKADQQVSALWAKRRLCASSDAPRSRRTLALCYLAARCHTAAIEHLTRAILALVLRALIGPPNRRAPVISSC